MQKKMYFFIFVFAMIFLFDSNLVAHSPEKRVFHWNMVTSWPRDYLILNKSLEEFAKDIEVMSQGQLKITVHGAGDFEKVSAFQVFDAVSEGTAEMGHSASYYWANKVIGCEFMCSVPFGMTPRGTYSWLYHGTGLKTWKKIYEPYNLIPFPMGNTGIQMGGWFNIEIKSIDSFKGLKMRIPGLGGQVLKEIGGFPIKMPSGDAHEKLRDGFIDAAEVVGPYHDKHLKLYRVAKNYYYPGWHEPGTTHELIINKDAWEKLPEHIKKAIEVASGYMNLKIWTQYEIFNLAALEELQDKYGVQLKKFPATVLEELKKRTEEVLKKKSKSHPQFKKIYEEYDEFREKYNKWNQNSYDAYKGGLIPKDPDTLDSKPIVNEIGKGKNIHTFNENCLVSILKGDNCFGFNKSVPTAALKSQIKRIAEIISKYSVKQIKVEGHTDSNGGESANLIVALNRAKAVRQLLINEGIPSALIHVIPVGAGVPIATNDSQDGQRKNRRIELRVYFE